MPVGDTNGAVRLRRSDAVIWSPPGAALMILMKPYRPLRQS
jgi:hypothetical protein